jgi:hypothetical protein
LYEKQSGVTRYFKYLLKGRDYDTEYDFDRILAVEITQIQNGFSCGDKNLILHRFFAEDLEP